MFRHGSRRQGQVSILIVLTLIPIMAIFAFSVNIGMLVNAKISLQNAADLAAYAGAATQARQLTYISHLNYQMRQAYKKFLLKYYVIGNMSLRCFPRDKGSQFCTQFGGTEPPDNQAFDFTNPRGGFPGVPTVCMSLHPESNPCQLGKAVPVVKSPECFPLDPVCMTLKASTDEIAKIQKQACLANSGLNGELLAMWLFAPHEDVDLQQIKQINIAGLVKDIGLVIENTMHLTRIKTIQEKHINVASQPSVNEGNISSLEKVPDQAANERTVLAFKTAKSNLNETVFSNIKMAELMPLRMLELEEIYINFHPLSTFMSGADTTKCELAIAGLFPGKDGEPPKLVRTPMGVVKNPPPQQFDKYDVFYAIKLTAEAKLLFNPFPLPNPKGDPVTLTAYAAAAPFGSRIGPKLSEQDFVRTMQNPKGQSFQVPILKVGNNGETMMWGKVLKDYHRILHGDGAGTLSITTSDFERMLKASQLPDEVEIGLYNIPVDAEYADGESAEDTMTTYFRNGGDYTFWAPLAAPGTPPGTVADSLKDVIATNINISQTQGGPKSNLAAYFGGKIAKKLGELAQKTNFNVARMKNPLEFQGSTVNFKVRTPQSIASSYTSEHDTHYKTAGRDGYSVKFVPLKNLKLQNPPNDIGAIDH